MEAQHSRRGFLLANEDDGQCGATRYNRDAQRHSHSNFVRNGLPLSVQKKLAAEIWARRTPWPTWAESLAENP